MLVHQLPQPLTLVAGTLDSPVLRDFPLQHGILVL
jgi:hypothetical protein